jgi:hypothetical protein
LVQRNFKRRQLALGDCGRAYGTSCIHEHSCVRCPLLRVDLNQRQRLIDIRDNLISRITEDKLAQIHSAVQRRNTVIELGMPAFSTIVGRTVSTSATLLDSQKTH